MDEAVVKLDDGRYIALWFSDNPAYTENCDACIGYNVYNKDRDMIDGGEMDYNSEEKNYQTIEDAIKDTISFAIDSDLFSYEYNESISIDEFECGSVF